MSTLSWLPLRRLAALATPHQAHEAQHAAVGAWLVGEPPQLVAQRAEALQHDVARLAILANALRAPVDAPDAALLHAAPWCLRRAVGDDDVVDQHRAGLDLARHALG